MKFFPLLLAVGLLAPSAALADANNNNGNGCRNRCGNKTMSPVAQVEKFTF
jgi:hypothetical protein